MPPLRYFLGGAPATLALRMTVELVVEVGRDVLAPVGQAG